MSAPEAPAAGPSGPGAAQGGPQMAEIQRLRDLVEKNPNDADAVLSLANLNFDIKNWARARELYERRLTLKPGDPDVMTDMGVCYRELGDFQQALGLFNQAQALAPDHWQSRYNKVVVLAFDLKDYDGAQKVLDELQRLQPGNPSIAELAAEVARRRSAA
jgi:tetratricopeptide (TPR) repeat protein